MASTKHKVHFSKRFLNKDGFMSDASIFSSIQIDTSWRIDEYIELKIRGCNDHVNLELTLEDDGDGDNNFENSLHKVDTLIQELSYLKVKMKEAKILFDKQREIVAEKKKKEEEEKESKKNENHKKDS